MVGWCFGLRGLVDVVAKLYPRVQVLCFLRYKQLQPQFWIKTETRDSADDLHVEQHLCCRDACDFSSNFGIDAQSL